jgi:dTDP-4-amino-4,6-dideoxygalactose transaminase
LRSGVKLSNVNPGLLDLFGNRHVAYSFNTRVAIRAVVDLLELVPGDEVLAPAYNCGSELDPLRAAGLTIRLYPVAADTAIEPDQIARLIGPRTRAIYLTHYFGVLQPHRAEVRALADARGLRVIEDCALRLLSGETPIEGRTGDVALFCFYKFFPVLAGGALVVNDPGLAVPDFPRFAPPKAVAKALVRAGLQRVLGQDGLNRFRRRWMQGQDESCDGLPDMPPGYYFDPGLAGRRISGLTFRALSGFDPMAAARARQANYLQMFALLADIEGLAPLFAELSKDTVPLSLPMRVKEFDAGSARARRDGLARALQAEGIAATPWWAGYNRYLDFCDQPGADLSVARRLKDTVISLPIHQYFGPVEIAYVADRVRRCWQKQGWR